jgi:purine-binding chemotaxis protein CheW
MSDVFDQSRDVTKPIIGRGATQQFLTFTIGEEEYGVDIMTVREIKGWTDTTRLPNTPEYMRGVMNLRGVVVPVIDLQARFGRPAADVSKKTCIVIFDSMRDGERVELGLMVDAVSEVIEIATDQIEPPPNFGTAVRRDFIQGMGKVAGRFVIVLEPDKAWCLLYDQNGRHPRHLGLLLQAERPHFYPAGHRYSPAYPTRGGQREAHCYWCCRRLYNSFRNLRGPCCDTAQRKAFHIADARKGGQEGEEP